MHSLVAVIQILTSVVGAMVALMSVLLVLRLHWPSPALWFMKLYVSALAVVLGSIGSLVVIVGAVTGSFLVAALGVYDASIFFMHAFRVTRAPDASSGFEHAFGSDWETRAVPAHRRHMLPRRFVLRLPATAGVRLKQDVPFATIAGTERQLLCNLWQPPEGVAPSGLAFIYLFGSAWSVLDKDLGTRPFFRHLAAQGHVVMDVAYRLAPETDMRGMVGDVKRAIAWMKEHADLYGVDPDRIVVGGGSAGGHLALLAAYCADNSQFTPSEIEGKDLRVCGVISIYGPSDLEAMYYHTNQHITTRDMPGRPRKPAPSKLPQWMVKRMGKEYYRLHFDKGFANAGAFVALFGGHPDECPEKYSFFSPITHVHSGCPPTLLIHGEHDVMAPVQSTRELHARLQQNHVTTIMHILPQSDHAFDLILPKISLSAHNAIYDIERFLAMLLRAVVDPEKKSEERQPVQQLL